MLTTKLLQSLEVHKTYTYIDKSLIFSLYSSDGKYYFCYWIGDKEGFDKYFLKEISPKELFDYELSKICIRTVLDNGNWFEIHEKYDNDKECMKYSIHEPSNIELPRYGLFNDWNY